MIYSLEERQNIYETFIECGRNMRQARREYQRKYPLRVTPSTVTFKNIANKFRETHTLANLKHHRRSQIVTENLELDILLYFIDNPNQSLQHAANYFNISIKSVWNCLKKHKYKPFKLFPSQKLCPNDFVRRRTFCEIMLGHVRDDPNFLQKIIWTDESTFSTSGMFNRKNCHFWGVDKPNTVFEIKKQGRRSLNVWCGIVGNKIIGPIFIEGRFNGEYYRNLLNTDIEDLIDEMPLRERFRVIWQQDGAPPHNIREVVEFLTRKYQIWIGNTGPIRWPARSPDLSPLDFFFGVL